VPRAGAPGIRPGAPGNAARGAARERAASVTQATASVKRAGSAWLPRGPGRILSLTVLLAPLAPALAAPPPDAVAEARRVEAALNGVRGLVARFTQTVESPGLPRPQLERGTVYLLRPGRMRWEYDEPRGKLAVSDGRKSWLYLPEERRALVAPLRSIEAGRGVPLLMRGRIDLTGDFDIDWGPRTEDGARPLMLTPRSPSAEYRFLLLEPGPDHLVRLLTAVDPLGARVTYRFSLVKQVADLDEALFRFVPPEGVTVEEPAP
jgi:outer membrane lipoprotein carrier protein